jgi:NADPH-dependent F420 reductase
MSTVTILGTGNMGSVLATLAEKGGNTVQSLDSQDTDVRVDGDLVILAVPWPAVTEVLSQRRDQLNGKVVVDITNPVDFETFDSLTVDPDSSAAAQIASALPDAQVLKAFNTNFAATLQSGTVGDTDTAVLIAGDDERAKGQLADLVTAGGLRAVDAGSLRRARELEALGFLQMTLAASERIPWTGGFALPS